MPLNHVSLHLDISGQNSAGSVFSSPPSKLVVLRWECHDSLMPMIKLIKMAHNEMADSGADSLVYDMRMLPAVEGLTNDVAAQIYCAQNKVVRHLAWLTVGPTVKSTHPDVASAVALSGVQVCAGHTFDDIARILDSWASGSNGMAILGEKPVGFGASYAGSWYSLPELDATVMRTAGNTSDLSLASKMFLEAFELHKNMGAKALIVDSSATPPIADMRRYIHAYQDLIVPMGTCGMFKQTIHVRAGDPLFPEGAPSIGPLVTSFGVTFYEVSLMGDAIELLRILKGKTRPVETIRTIPTENSDDCC
jgi:hypothetical protein